MNDTDLLSTEALTVTIGAVRVCDALSLALAPRQRWAVLGANGVGKTTLLHVLAGLRAPDRGTVHLEGRPLAAWPRAEVARRIGVVFQDDSNQFPSTVAEAVALGRHPHLRPWQWEGEADRACVREALAAVGLGGLAQRMLHTLSGGERRRVALATVLAQAPRVLLLDEPTGHLDVRHQVEMLARLREWTEHRGAAAWMILHDVNLAAQFATHALLLFGDGECQHGPIDQVLDAKSLSRLYRCPMRAVPADPRPVWAPQWS